jgi:hypothetical protein
MSKLMVHIINYCFKVKIMLKDVNGTELFQDRVQHETCGIFGFRNNRDVLPKDMLYPSVEAVK